MSTSEQNMDISSKSYTFRQKGDVARKLHLWGQPTRAGPAPARPGDGGEGEEGISHKIQLLKRKSTSRPKSACFVKISEFTATGVM